MIEKEQIRILLALISAAQQCVAPKPVQRSSRCFAVAVHGLGERGR